MLGVDATPLLETAIGLVFLWFLAATVCSGVVQLVSSALGFHANTLWRTLERALGTDEQAPNAAIVSAAKMSKKPKPCPGTMVDRFIENVPGVSTAKVKRVKQIGTNVAAQALVATRNDHPDDFAATQLGKLVEHLPDDIRNDEEKLRQWLARWYDDTMSTLSATFRRNIRWWTVVASIVIVGVLGLESIGFAERLYQQPTQRAVVTAQAKAAVAAGKKNVDGGLTQCKKVEGTKNTYKCAKATVSELSGLKVSLWEVPEDKRPDWWWTLLGLAVTVGAIAAGAPFWFDVMRRLSGLRKSTPTTTSPAIA